MAEETMSNPCPEKWTQATWVDLGCLLFNTTKSYTWEQAAVYCQSSNLNSTLVTFQDEEQMEFIQMELEALEEAVGARDWWTSGTDITREGQWVWLSSLTPVPEFVWHSGQPAGGVNENCLMLSASSNYAAHDF